MTAEELINELKKFPSDMEVHYDVNGGYTTFYIDEVDVMNAYYNDEEKKVIVLR